MSVTDKTGLPPGQKRAALIWMEVESGSLSREQVVDLVSWLIYQLCVTASVSPGREFVRILDAMNEKLRRVL